MAAPAVPFFSGPSIVISQADSAEQALSWQLCCQPTLIDTSLLSRPFTGRARVHRVRKLRAHKGDTLSDKVQLDADIKMVH